MKFNLVLLIATFTSLLTPQALAQQSIPNIAANTTNLTKDPIVQPGTVIYKVPANASPQELKSLNALLKSQGLVSSRTLDGSKIVIATFEHIGREKATAQIIKNSSLVEFAEPDYAVSPSAEPNDPNFSNQWHHNNVNSRQAWDITTGNTSVLTAVCDTGFDANHPDLAGNLRLDLAYNAQDDSDYIYDANGHGTGTAGTLGAVGNNGVGVAGANWNVDIIPVRIAISDSNSSAYISTMAKCIEYAADNGARIVNLSYGGIQYATIDSAAQYLRTRNGLLFMSAGNDGQSFSYPDYPSFIGVGATDENDNRASFSSWGDYVDITAPGVRILTTYPSNRYVYYSGTSFSSPLTAGIAALMVAANPAITPEDIENGLFSTATDIGSAGDDNVFGHGLVNAEAAVNYATNLGSVSAPTAVINVSSQSVPFGTPINFSATNSSDSDGNITSYQWTLGDGNTSTQAAFSYDYAQAGSYQVNLTVTDNDGLTDSDTVNIQVTNELPIAVIDDMLTSYNLGEPVDFSALASFDPDGDIVEYNWEFGDGESASGSAVTHSYTTTGNFTVNLTVSDNAGAINSTSMSLTVSDPFSVNAPSNLSAETDGLAIALQWLDNSNNEDYFIVERGQKYRGKTSYSAIATLAANTTGYTDNVDEAGEYSYRVTAGNSVEQSTSTAIKVAVEDSQPAPSNLPTPTNLIVTQSGTTLTLTWTDNAETESGFYIEQGVKRKGQISFATVGEIGQNITIFETSSEGLSGSYGFRVRAYATTSAGEEVSAYSNVVELRIK